MSLLLPNKRQRLLNSPVRLALLIMRKKVEGAPVIIDDSSSLDLSEEATRALEVFGEGMSSAFYIYDAGFSDVEEFHKGGSREESAESVYFLLCNPPCNERLQIVWENLSQDLFWPNDMDDFCDLPKTLKNPGCMAMCFVLCFCFPLYGEYRSSARNNKG